MRVRPGQGRSRGRFCKSVAKASQVRILDLPPPGHQVVKDTGQVVHALEIDGPGVADQSTGELPPGGSASLDVTLSLGKYEIYCPVDGHKAKGMATDITIS